MAATLKTQSAGGVILSGNDIAVVSQHSKNWSLPKGHREENETLLDTAYREVYEETGLTHLTYIQTLTPYTRYKIGKTNDTEDTSEEKELHFFLFKTDQRHLQSQDPDNPDVCWIPIEDVESKLTHPKDKAFFVSIKPLLHAHTCKLIRIETTFPTEKEALNLSNVLIKQNLAACCQISPITSIYSWENKVETSNEYTCSIKTLNRFFDPIQTLIQSAHPYDCPQIIASSINTSDPKYLNWALTYLNPD